MVYRLTTERNIMNIMEQRMAFGNVSEQELAEIITQSLKEWVKGGNIIFGMKYFRNAMSELTGESPFLIVCKEVLEKAASYAYRREIV